jgi:hypothetical protein
MMANEVETLRSATKLKGFLVGQRNPLTRLLRAVPWGNVLWFLLGWVLMLLVPPEEEAPKPPESAEHARRRDGAQ